MHRCEEKLRVAGWRHVPHRAGGARHGGRRRQHQDRTRRMPRARRRKRLRQDDIEQDPLARVRAGFGAGHLQRARQADRCAGARCLDPGTDFESADGSAEKAGADLLVHLAQSGGCRLHRGPHRGDVRRPHRRTGAARRVVPQPGPSLYAGAACGGAGARPVAPARFPPADGRARLRSARLARALPARPRPGAGTLRGGTRTFCRGDGDAGARDAARSAPRRAGLRYDCEMLNARHSGDRAQRGSPESMNAGLWNMASGLSAARRPGMTRSYAPSCTRRMVRRLLPGVVASFFLALPVSARAALLETPMFTEAVAKGTLPAIDERVPRAPALAELETLGRPGGDLRMLMSSPKDTLLMVVYGYSRLVAYTPALALVPDILEAADVEDDRVFTLRLRTGHKWSDGQPFTTEDFRYWFEDVAEDADLSPSGLPVAMLPNGERPKFEVLDARTVRFSWSRANPLFLPALAGPDPMYIYCPAHYLKQFHKKYADKKKLDELVKQIGARNWAALHSKMDVMYRNDNPDLPSLEPWVLKTKPPSERLVFERNPYYYRIDGAGHQLPYLARVVLSIATSRLIPAKAGAGESDLQARYLSFDDYTFLKAGEATGGYKVRR